MKLTWRDPSKYNNNGYNIKSQKNEIWSSDSELYITSSFISIIIQTWRIHQSWNKNIYCFE